MSDFKVLAYGEPMEKKPTKCENCACLPICTFLARIRGATAELDELEDLGIRWELSLNCDWYVGKE